jgi:hypothetical protein
MRRRLIEALTYPRLFVLKEIGLKDCPHDSVFDASWDRCRNCGLGQECHWLSCLNDFADLSDKSVHTLHSSLLYSINLIEAHIEEIQHDIWYCDCEPCSWIREAEQLSHAFAAQYDCDIKLSAGDNQSPTRTIS